MSHKTNKKYGAVCILLYPRATFGVNVFAKIGWKHKNKTLPSI